MNGHFSPALRLFFKSHFNSETGLAIFSLVFAVSIQVGQPRLAAKTPTYLPPTVTITSPASHATVSGSVSIQGWALDNATQSETAIAGVTITLDAQVIGPATYGDYSPQTCQRYRSRPGCPNVGFHFTIDSTTFSNGNHTIVATATDRDPTPHSSTASIVLTFQNTAAPAISSFSANPATISPGQSSTLSWTVSGSPIPALSISPGVGAVTGNFVSVSLSTTTTYTLTASNSAGQATAQTTITVKDTTPPSIPANLTASAVSFSSIDLSWSASTDDVGVAGYNIYRCTGNACVPTFLAGTTAPSYSDTALAPTLTYTYTVQAYDAAGNISSQSPAASTTTPVAQPGSVPPEFSDLFPSLQNYLATYNSTLTSLWDGTKPLVLFGAELPPADNYYVIYTDAQNSPNPPDSKSSLNTYFTNSTVPYINALKALGGGVVKIQFHFPMLYQPFYQDYLNDLNLTAFNNTVWYYQQTVNCLHSQGIKVIIQSQVQAAGNGFSGSDPLNLAGYYSSTAHFPDFNSYVSARAQNTLNIAQLLQPDFLNFSPEPDTEGEKTTAPVISSALASNSGNPDFANNVNQLQDAILDTLISANPPGLHSSLKLVVGMGSWEYQYQTIVNNEIALGSGIDLYSIHVHPINKISGNDLLGKTLTIADSFRAAGKQVGMDENWVYKQRDSEFGAGAPPDATVESRDHWSFWAPVDQAFLQAMAKTAYYENMVYFSASAPSQFFAYLDYYNTGGCDTIHTTALPPSSVCSANQWNKASNQAIYPVLTSPSPTFTSTANYYASLIAGVSP